MTIHPHDKTLPERSPERRLRFERAFLRMTTAATIENLLDALELPHAELARRLGKSPAWVSKVLSGRQNVTLDTLAHVGVVLGIRWNPEMVLAPREGTPAVDDPPMPDWVEQENQITFSTFEQAPEGGPIHGLSWVSSPGRSAHTLFMSMIGGTVVPALPPSRLDPAIFTTILTRPFDPQEDTDEGAIKWQSLLSGLA